MLTSPPPNAWDLAVALTAPECLLGAEDVGTANTLLWSLGALLHVSPTHALAANQPPTIAASLRASRYRSLASQLLLVGEPPFDAKTAPQLLQLIFSGGTAHPRLSAQTSAFLSSLLRPDPAKRSPAKTALAHAWLQGPAGGVGAEPVYSEAHTRDPTAHHAPRALLQALGARLTRCHVDQLLERCVGLVGDG